MNRKISIKKMLNDIGVEPDVTVYRDIIYLIEDIDDNDGFSRGALTRAGRNRNSRNAVSQNIYLLIQIMVTRYKGIYNEITGSKVPIEPKKFVPKLYNYWESKYKEGEK